MGHSREAGSCGSLTSRQANSFVEDIRTADRASLNSGFYVVVCWKRETSQPMGRTSLEASYSNTIMWVLSCEEGDPQTLHREVGSWRSLLTGIK